MPVLRCLTCAMALLLALSLPVVAGCRDLVQAIVLAERSFVSGATPDAGELSQLNDLLTGISNDELLALLRTGGRATAFGDLRNFLTQLRFISTSTDRSAFQLTAQMRQDLDLAQDIIDTVCTGETVQPGPKPAATETTQRADGPRITVLERWLNNQRTLRAGKGASSQEDGQVHMLAQLVLLVLAAAAVVIAAHYTVQLLGLMRRKRRICSIRAELVCMMTTVPGHVTVLELSGCSFTPTSGREAEEMHGVSSGTYCSIWIDSVELNARLTSTFGDVVEMTFAEPLSPDTYAAFLDQSDQPVRFDLSTLRQQNSAASTI